MRHLVWICVLGCALAFTAKTWLRQSVAATELQARIDLLLCVPDEGFTQQWLVDAHVGLCAEMARAGELLSRGEISEREFEVLSLSSCRAVHALCLLHPPARAAHVGHETDPPPVGTAESQESAQIAAAARWVSAYGP